MGIKLELKVYLDERDVQPIWNAFVPEIWPIFATNIRHLSFTGRDPLDNLRRLISPTILTDLDKLDSIETIYLLPDVIADDGPNATARQALAKWLHTPTKDGQPKRLRCNGYLGLPSLKWINNYKETFRHATTSSSYIIQLIFDSITTPTAGPFELVNERTNEKLILWEESENNWLLKRCPIIIGETAAIQWENAENWDTNLNNVQFILWRGINCIGPLLSPEEEKEKADE